MMRHEMHFLNVRELCIGGVTKDELLRRLAAHSVQLNDYARALFADVGFTASTEVTELRLALVSLPEIGLPDGGVFDDIVARAADVGLEPCPLEVGPHLRLSFLDQAEGPYLTIASPMPPAGASTPNGFYLRRLEDGLWLRGYQASPEHVFAPEFTDWVFVFPER